MSNAHTRVALQHVLGVESNFIALVIHVFAWSIAVKASEVTEHVSVVPGLGIEAVHHQLWQGQGFKGLIQVLPAVEGSRAADGGVETVQVDIVGLECFQVMTRKELLCDFARHLAHVRAVFSELSGEGHQHLLVAGEGVGKHHGCPIEVKGCQF